MCKRFIVALVMTLSLPLLAGAEEIAPSSKDSQAEEALKSIDYMLDNITLDILIAESDDADVSGKASEDKPDSAPDTSAETLSEDAEIAEPVSRTEDESSPSSLIGADIGDPILSTPDESGDNELPSFGIKNDPVSPYEVEKPVPISIEPSIITIPEPAPTSQDETESHDEQASRDVDVTVSQDKQVSNDVLASRDVTASSDKLVSQDVHTSPDVTASKDEQKVPDVIVPDVIVYKSQITPEEFRRMCEEATSELVLNAIENRNSDVNAADPYGITPLMFAAKSNSSPEIIGILVKAGADINAKDNGGKTALMYASESNPHPEIISALAANGANMNTRNNNRRTALMYAARMNNADVVKALIDAGAEELADSNGWTPLFWAARYTEHPEVIGTLLDAGHNPKAHSYDMAKPIEHANLNPKLMNTKELVRLAEESR